MYNLVQRNGGKVTKFFIPLWIRKFYTILKGKFTMASSSIVTDNVSDPAVSIEGFYRIIWFLILLNFTYSSHEQMKAMDANRYATKKTIAQGMLDIALLTANASQLKYILQVGHRHEFYTLMLILISVSIIMQVFLFY